MSKKKEHKHDWKFRPDIKKPPGMNVQGSFGKCYVCSTCGSMQFRGTNG